MSEKTKVTIELTNGNKKEMECDGIAFMAVSNAVQDGRKGIGMDAGYAGTIEPMFMHSVLENLKELPAHIIENLPTEVKLALSIIVMAKAGLKAEETKDMVIPDITSEVIQ